MTKLLPFLLPVLYGLIMYRLSAWRSSQMLNTESRPLQDPGLHDVFSAMARALDLEQIKVNLYQIDAVNGLAAHDGRIFITDGFYQRYRAGEVTAEEIASVIAHELGHVALGHSRRRLIEFSGQNAMRVALGMILSRIIPGFGAQLAGVLTRLLAARLSREDEYEADAYAAALLVKSGIGVDAQISMFEKLPGLMGGKAPLPAWLMNHPKTEDRIAALYTLKSRWTAEG